MEVVGSIVLEVSGSTFSNVRAPKSGAGILFGDGTGGSLTITDSAFSGCEASGPDTRGACVFSTTATTVDSTSFANWYGCRGVGGGGGTGAVLPAMVASLLLVGRATVARSYAFCSPFRAR